MTPCPISSAFCGPYITWNGSPSATDTNAFQIIGNDIIPDQFGFLIYSINGPANLNFHNGTLCIKAPFTRLLPPKNSGSPGMGFCPGELTTNFNKRIQSGLDATLTVGQQVNAMASPPHMASHYFPIYDTLALLIVVSLAGLLCLSAIRKREMPPSPAATACADPT